MLKCWVTCHPTAVAWMHFLLVPFVCFKRHLGHMRMDQNPIHFIGMSIRGMRSCYFRRCQLAFDRLWDPQTVKSITAEVASDRKCSCFLAFIHCISWGCSKEGIRRLLSATEPLDAMHDLARSHTSWLVLGVFADASPRFWLA